MSTLDKYKVLIDKSIPPEYKMALGGIASLIGCSSPNAPDETMDDMPLYSKGDQVCYVVGNTPEPITLDEDIRQGQQTVRATRQNGQKIGASVDYIVDNSYCTK